MWIKLLTPVELTLCSFKVLFLQNRENNPETATLLTGGSGGLVRAWSIFGSTLLGQFMVAQDHRESCTALATDDENTVFVSGDTLGYVKVSQYRY